MRAGTEFGTHRFDPNEFYVGHCLNPATTFKSISSEKGGTVTHSGDYDPDSLFSLTDSWKSGFETAALHLDSAWTATGYRPETVTFTPSLSVCDDMANECADFILADEADRRVVLVARESLTRLAAVMVCR